MTTQVLLEANLSSIASCLREGEVAVRLGGLQTVMSESLVIKRGTFLFIDGRGSQIQLSNDAQFVVEDGGRLCLFNLALEGGSRAQILFANIF